MVVGTVATGADALSLCREVQPDLALIHQSIAGDLSASQIATRLARLGPVPSVFLLGDDGVSADMLKNADDLPSLVAAQPLAVVPAHCTEAELLAIIVLAVQQAETLQKAREPDDRFFAIAIDLLCFLDFSGVFRRLSPAWERTLGFTVDELMSRPFIEFVHPDDRARTLEQNRAVRHGGQALGFENRYRCKDGSYRWLRWNAAADTNRGLIYSVARDVTDAKLAGEEREALILDLQRALAEVRSLQEIIPICAYCKKVRDDDDYWQHVESYIAEHTGAKFSHGVCPSCYDHVLASDLDGTE